MIIPALQIRRGRAVALRPDGTTVDLPEPPAELAETLYRYGEIAVLDLDAAREEGDNLQLIQEICRVAECRVGGGIRVTLGNRLFFEAGMEGMGWDFLIEGPFPPRVMNGFREEVGHYNFSPDSGQITVCQVSTSTLPALLKRLQLMYQFLTGSLPE